LYCELERIQASTLVGDLCRRNRIRKLALFGSALRVDFRPD